MTPLPHPYCDPLSPPALSGEEASGGKSGNHERKRLPVGHIRTLLSRAKVTVQEARSLHGFVSAIIDVVAPGHPLGSKRSRAKIRGGTKAEVLLAGVEITKVADNTHNP